VAEREQVENARRKIAREDTKPASEALRKKRAKIAWIGALATLVGVVTEVIFNPVFGFFNLAFLIPGGIIGTVGVFLLLFVFYWHPD